MTRSWATRRAIRQQPGRSPGSADDQVLVRAGFRLLVDSAADLEVVGEATDVPRRWRWPAGNDPMWC